MNVRLLLASILCLSSLASAQTLNRGGDFDRRDRGDRLICKTGPTGLAAIYDLRNDAFVDDYYSKTLDQCLDSIGR